MPSVPVLATAATSHCVCQMKRVNVDTREQMQKTDVIDLTEGAPQPSRALSVPRQTSSAPDSGVMNLADNDSDSDDSASNTPQQAPRSAPPAPLPASHQTGHCHRHVRRQLNNHALPPTQRQPTPPHDRIVGIGKQYDEDREKRQATAASSRQPQQDVLSPLQQIVNRESEKQKAAINPARQHAAAGMFSNTATISCENLLRRSLSVNLWHSHSNTHVVQELPRLVVQMSLDRLAFRQALNPHKKPRLLLVCMKTVFTC